MNRLNTPINLDPFKLLQKAYGARNTVRQRAYGRKMSTPATVYQMVTSLPGNADGPMEISLGGNSKTALQDDMWATSLTGWTSGYDSIVSGKYRITHTVMANGYRDISSILDVTKYWLVTAYGTSASDTDGAQFRIWNGLINDIKVSTILTKTQSARIGLILQPSDLTGKVPYLAMYNYGSGYAEYSQFFIQEISSAEYAEGLTVLMNRYPYRTAGIKYTQSQRAKVVGKNLFDGKLESGNYNTSTGVKQPSGTMVRAVNKMIVKPNTTYTLKSHTEVTYLYPLTWDNNGNLIRYEGASNSSGLKTFTTDANTRFLSFYVLTTNLNCLFSVVEDDIALPEYEPYQESVSYFPPVGRSLQNGTKDVINGDGKRAQGVGRVILNGSENWANRMASVTDDGINMIFSLSGIFTGIYTSSPVFNNDVFVNKGIVGGITHAYSLGEGLTLFNDGSYLYITIVKVKLSTVSLSGFKEWLASNPVTITYQLASPVLTQYLDMGQLDALPNGTLIVEPVVSGVGLPVLGKIAVTTAEAPILSIESVFKVDIALDGKEIKTDVTSLFTLDADKLGITYTGADSKATYEYVCLIDPAYSTIPAITYSYPELTTQDWAIASHDYGGAAADWVLTDEEAKCGILVCTNAGGAANIIAPNIPGRVYFVKNTSGQNIVFKSTGDESGTTILTGNSVIVFNNGGA